MLLSSVHTEPTNVRKATVRRRTLACVLGMFLKEYRSVGLAYSISAGLQLTFKRDKKHDGQVHVDYGVERYKWNHGNTLHTNDALPALHSRNSAGRVRKAA